jgi:hypothetical protein
MPNYHQAKRAIETGDEDKAKVAYAKLMIAKGELAAEALYLTLFQKEG